MLHQSLKGASEWRAFFDFLDFLGVFFEFFTRIEPRLILMQMYSPADEVKATHAPLTTHHDAVRGTPYAIAVMAKWMIWMVAAKSKHCFARPTIHPSNPPATGHATKKAVFTRQFFNASSEKSNSSDSGELGPTAITCMRIAKVR